MMKFFLLHICLNKSYNIPLSESTKVMMTSSIDNLSIFLKKQITAPFMLNWIKVINILKTSKRVY
jgi:hypothetical protein